MKAHLFMGALILAATTLGGSVLSCHRDSNGQVIFVNNGSHEVTQGEIIVCGQRLIFEKLKPGDKKLMSYKVTGDSHYQVSVRLGSGKQLGGDLGYVTNGFDFETTIVVTDERIVLKDHKPSRQE